MSLLLRMRKNSSIVIVTAKKNKMGSVQSTTKKKEGSSQLNKASLKTLIQYIEQIVKEYPDEAQVPFKKALKWMSTAQTSSLDHLDSTMYTSSNEGIASTLKLEDGNPVMKLKNSGNEGTDVEVWTLKSVCDLLACIGEDSAIQEAKACLSANSDPVLSILGPAFGEPTLDTLLQVRDRLAKDSSSGEVETRSRLYLLLINIDTNMLNSIAKQDGREACLTPNAINDEVELIACQSGNSDDNCLKRINFTSSLVFANGCHAPPWYQLYGDICYLSVEPWDSDTITVTANQEGCYRNEGLVTSGRRPERSGDLYPDLRSLLAADSQRFTDNFKSEASVSFKDRPQLNDNDYIATSSNIKKESLMFDATRNQLNRPNTRNSRSKGVMMSQDSKMRSTSSAKSNNDMSGTCEDSDSSDSGSEEEDLGDRRPESTADLPSEYWQIQKLIKYLKGGNQTATVIALCLLLDFDLTLESSHLAIRDNGGLDTLINLLETDDIKCKIGTLRILKIISTNTQTRSAIVDLKGLPQLVDILRADNRELKCLSAETIAHIARFKRGRRIVRHQGGLQYLVDMLESPGRPGSPISGERSDIEVSRAAAQGLWSCSQSKKNKMALLKTNVVPLLGRLLQSQDEGVLIPVVGTLQECASESMYQSIIRSEGMVEYLVKGLHLESTELKMHCAAAIFKCAEDDSTRELVHKFNGLESLAKLLSATDDKELLTAATGAIWKCSKNSAIVQQLKQLKAVEKLVSLITNQPEEVQINVVGALGESAAQDGEIRLTIRKAGGITPLVQLLTGTNQPLLVNTTKAVGACAMENESMVTIDKQDGVRLLWSLLKSPNPEVQACAAWAICPCIQNARDAGELVRSFVGGLELIVGLLKSEDDEVLASVCAAIAKIAQDEENLAVITDHGVVSMLSRLTNTYSDRLRHHLADAIARCCSWRNNRIGFGQNEAVAPLVQYLRSPDPMVHQTTACALYQLSKDPSNCITMHEAGVVQLLLPMVGSKDDILQEAAAGCISNIRHLALANEKAKHR